ncbi:hypothetical protein Poli38472_004909 [Pythium oligandrum]|uniref:Uncharacterized protein n=1 Tax=Pythium oligandrum TaxID=41045 RepID=A0A8K1CBN0_PYTOL|nr:hypothetical protein Poli38472_004909 [Pythium oligandrum]|eukprot:TMW59840.1 hypothetical protein Poli38472_004909 [Pythium oligandrum]
MMALDWVNLPLDDGATALEAALALLDESSDGAESDLLAPMECLVCEGPECCHTSQHGESDASSLEDELLDTFTASAIGESQTSPVSVESTSTLDSARPRVSRQNNTTRVRRRNEILYLRDTVREMEETLGSMKRRKTEALVASTPEDGSMGALWHNLALRQQHQRQAAELENARLRSVLQTQVKVGKNLLRVLQRSSEDMIKASDTAPQHQHSMWHNTTEEQLFAPMGTFYAQSATAFSSPQFAVNAKPFRDIKVVEATDTSVAMVLHVNWVFPFSFDRVLPAFWLAATKQRAERCAQFYPSTPSSSDTIFSVFNSKKTNADPSAISTMHGKIAIKRFHDGAANGPAVFISHMHADLTTADTVALENGVSLCGVAWVRIQEVPREGASPMTQEGSSSLDDEVLQAIMTNAINEAQTPPASLRANPTRSSYQWTPLGNRPHDSTGVRRRHEIRYLHDKVQEMEETLRTAKRQRTEALVATSVAWHHLAVRQQHQRRLAELENARLRSVLQTQIKVAKDMLRALQDNRQQMSESLERVAKERRPRWYNTSDKRLLAPMDAFYAQTPSVFPSPKFAFDAKPFRDLGIVEAADTYATLLLHVNWVFPYAFRRVLPAFWQAASQQVSQQNATVQRNAPSSTALCPQPLISVFNSTSTSSNPCAVSAIHGKVAIKRFHDPNSQSSAVFISHMHADLTTADAASPESDVTLCGVAWIRIQEIPQDEASLASPLTQVQISRRLSLEIYDGAVAPQQHVGALTHCVLSQIEAELVWKQQAIENLLFS